MFNHVDYNKQMSGVSDNCLVAQYIIALRAV